MNFDKLLKEDDDERKEQDKYVEKLEPYLLPNKTLEDLTILSKDEEKKEIKEDLKDTDTKVIDTKVIDTTVTDTTGPASKGGKWGLEDETYETMPNFEGSEVQKRAKELNWNNAKKDYDAKQNEIRRAAMGKK